MTAFAVAVGIAIVALVLWDVAGTVLHPTQRGPLCQAVNRGSWVTARTVGRVSGRAGVLTSAGPLGLTATILVWIVGLAVGYALTCT